MKFSVCRGGSIAELRSARGHPRVSAKSLRDLWSRNQPLAETKKECPQGMILVYIALAGQAFFFLAWKKNKKHADILSLLLYTIKKRPPERSLSVKLKLFSCVLLECFKFSSEFLGKLVAKLAVEFFDALSIFSPESLVNVKD